MMHAYPRARLFFRSMNRRLRLKEAAGILAASVLLLAGSPIVLADPTLSLVSGPSPYFGSDGVITKVEILPDGGILIAGDFNRIGDQYPSAICRLLPSGEVDPAFQVSSFQGDVIRDFAVQDDGKILVCGRFNQLNGLARGTIARLNADGTVDPDFRMTGQDPFWSDAKSIALLPNGGAIATGSFKLDSMEEAIPLIRVSADGTINAELDLEPGFPIGKVITTDTGFFVAGAQGTHQTFVAAYDFEGNKDTSFAPDLMASERSLLGPSVPDFTVDPATGHVHLGLSGFHDPQRGSFIPYMVLDREGTVVRSYTRNQLGLADVRAIEQTSSREVVLAGWTGHFYGGKQLGVSTVRANGTFSRGPTITVPMGSGNTAGFDGLALALEGEDRILIGGRTMDQKGVVRRGLARLLPEGDFDPDFFGHIGCFSSTQTSVSSIDHDPSGRMIAAGRFSIVNDTFCRSVVRLHADGTVDPTFAPELYPINGYSLVRCQEEAIFLGGWQPVNQPMTYELLVKLDANGQRDPGFRSALYDLLSFISVIEFDDLDRLYIGGAHLGKDDPYANLLRLHPDGNLDQSFQADQIQDPIGPESAFHFSWVTSLQWLPEQRELLVSGRFGTPDEAVNSLVFLTESGQIAKRSKDFQSTFPAREREALVINENLIAVVGMVQREREKERYAFQLLDGNGSLLYELLGPIGGSLFTSLEPWNDWIIFRESNFPEPGRLFGIKPTSDPTRPAFTNTVEVSAQSGGVATSPRSGRTLLVGGNFTMMDGQSRPNLAVLTLDDDTSEAVFLNTSSRGIAAQGSETLILGFVVEGQTTKEFLVRAVGPSLAPMTGDSELLVKDPRLVLYRGTTRILVNDNWGDEPDREEIKARAAEVGAFALLPESRDAAVLIHLEPGAYTGMMPDLTSGIGLLEVYDADPSIQATRLINTSCRGTVRPGNAALISGFVLNEDHVGPVLIRAIGPGLAEYGVDDFLPDPMLKIYRDDQEIASNDDWESNGNLAALTNRQAAVSGMRLEAKSKDAALLLDLPPGLYSAHALSGQGESGITLLEIYP